MKKLTKRIVLIVLTMFTTVIFSQGFKPLDNIPHDIVYYRATRVTKPLVKVMYGRPTAKSNEKVFGTKIPFNEIWRTGSNEATEIKIYNEVLFGDKLVNAGTYVLYTIPGEKEWEIILSSNTDVLGAFQYDPIFNVAKIRVPISKAEKLDSFSIGFKKTSNDNISMVLAWGTTRVSVPMGFNKQEYNVIAFDE